MIQGYFVQEVVGAVKPVHYEQKHLKFNSNLKAELGHDCVKWLTVKMQAVRYYTNSSHLYTMAV